MELWDPNYEVGLASAVVSRYRALTDSILQLPLRIDPGVVAMDMEKGMIGFRWSYKIPDLVWSSFIKTYEIVLTPQTDGGRNLQLVIQNDMKRGKGILAAHSLELLSYDFILEGSSLGLLPIHHVITKIPGFEPIEFKDEVYDNGMPAVTFVDLALDECAAMLRLMPKRKLYRKK